MANNNTIPLKDYCEQFCKEHGVKVDIKELLDFITRKAKSLAHNANSIGIDNSLIDQWILDSPNELKKEKEKKATVKKAETKKTEVKEEKKETPKSAYKWTPNKKEKEEEKEEEVVIEQLDLF